MQQYWDILGTERVLNITAGGNNQGQSQLMQKLAKRDPQEFTRHAPALLETLKGDERANFEALLYQIKADSENADDRIAANDWLDTQKSVKRELNAANVTQLLQMALVARKLKREDAAGWIDYAAAIAGQIPNGQQQWGGAVAQLGYDAATQFVEGAKPAAEFRFWLMASMGLAREGDVANAQRALARMEELAKTPELVEAGKKQDYNNPTRQIAEARQFVALALAKTDAMEALDLLTKTASPQRGGLLMEIADRALDAKNNAAVQRAIREIFAQKNGNADEFARAASLAQEISPQLGAEFWPEALKRALPEKGNEFDDDYRPSVGAWAFYHARLDAGQSRVLIEREWNWRLPAAVKTKDQEYSFDKQNLRMLEMGMAAVDPARALEMREESRAQLAKPGAATPAAVLLGAAILASDAQRARLNPNPRYFD